MPRTLSEVAKSPKLFTSEITLPTGEAAIFRPLEPYDATLLAQFLEDLSSQTREFYTLESYNIRTAKKMCGAINRYDKLRFVVTEKSAGKIIALFEYSFDIPEGDTERFVNYNITLDPRTDCRFGPCIADRLQNRGAGSALFPTCITIAHQFGKERIVLWGGVMRDNRGAIKFYEKQGFVVVGYFINQDGSKAVDMILDIK